MLRQIMILSALLLSCSLAWLACGGDDGNGGSTGPTTQLGSIQVTLSVDGIDLDPDGCTFTVAGASQRRLAAGESTTYTGLSVGEHTVAIADVAGNCQVQGEVSRQVSVTANQTTSVSFSVTCASQVGSIAVFLTTTGEDVDDDGYELLVDGGASVAIGVNGSTTVDGLSLGEHTVQLAGIAANCSVMGDNPLSVTVVAGQTTQETFTVVCDWRTRIAFSSIRGGDFDIYVMNPDGTGQVNLTNHVGGDDLPAWSPDGTQIAFVSYRDGNSNIYVMNRDGTGQVLLTEDPSYDTFPSWSPDGTRIAFVSDRDGSFEIYAMNADGTAPVRLTDNSSNEYDLAWSPDGTTLAFQGNPDNAWGVYVMNADGTGQATLIAPSSGAPAWSPDGTRIALGGYDGEVYLMNADGTGQTNLTNHPDTDDRNPTWSPDGTRIAFQRWLADNSEIYVMNADGTGQARLTDDPSYDTLPSWSPDLY